MKYLESKLINEANKQGINNGWLYLLGVFLSFGVGQMIGSFPLLIVMFSSDKFDFSDPMNFSNLGISNNVSFILMMLPFLASSILMWFFVKYVHKRPFLTVITPFKKINWSKLFYAFMVWLILLALVELTSYFYNPTNYVLQFDSKKFILLTLISFPFLFVQTGFEELLFRGYGMQWLGRYIPYRIFPLLITSIIFGLVHGANPEIKEFGTKILIDYIAIGFTLGLITLLSDSLEFAMGLHFANNLFASLFVTFDSSALQTDALFKLKELNYNGLSQLISLTIMIIFIIVINMKYPLKPLKMLWTKDNWRSNNSVNIIDLDIEKK